jgi:hypothetical protein
MRAALAVLTLAAGSANAAGGDLNDYITNLRRSPTWNRLVVKYFGASALDVLKKARGE